VREAGEERERKWEEKSVNLFPLSFHQPHNPHTYPLFPFIFFFFFCLSPLPRRHTGSARLVSRQRSRSLTELTRQIAPPTKNGHAPPPLESRKIRSVCQSSLSPDLVRFPVLSQIKPQTPFRWCPLPSIPLSFRLATILPPEPGNSKVSRNVVKKREGPGRSSNFFPPIPGWHRLRLGLRRYLIIFDPLTFVLG